MVFWTIFAIKVAAKEGRKLLRSKEVSTVTRAGTAPGGAFKGSMDRGRVYHRGHETLGLSKTKIGQFAPLFKTRPYVMALIRFFRLQN